MRFLVFFTTVLGIWLLFHLYVGWRLWSLPLFANTAGHRALVVAMAVGYVSYPLGRILFNHGAPRLGTVVEYAGAVWMGFLILLISALGLVDLVTVFGLVLKPWVVGLRTAAVGLAVILAVVAWVGGHAASANGGSRRRAFQPAVRSWMVSSSFNSPISTSATSSVPAACGR